MRVIPESIAGRVSFAETHAAIWQRAPEVVGLSPEIVAEVADYAEELRELSLAADNARDAARAATLAKNEADRKLATVLSGAVNRVKGAAKLAANPDAILAAAALPKPGTRRRPWGQPAPPTGLTAQPHSDGSISLKWKAPSKHNGSNGHRHKTVYAIDRQVTYPTSAGPRLHSTAWEHLATRATRDYRDTTVPSGIRNVTYRIRAMRNGEYSHAALTIVWFGRG